MMSEESTTKQQGSDKEEKTATTPEAEAHGEDQQEAEPEVERLSVEGRNVRVLMESLARLSGQSKTLTDISIVYIDRSQTFLGERQVGVRPSPERREPGPGVRLGDYALQPLPATEVERVRAVYVPLPGRDDAWQTLTYNGLVVLVGREGSGKRATGIHLLLSLRALDVLYEASPETVLADLGHVTFPRRAGILLESPSGRAQTNLDAFTWTALRRRLQEAGSALVVTTTRAEGVAASLPEGLVEFEPLTQGTASREWRAEVLKRHLLYYLPAEQVDEAAITHLLEQEEIARLLAEPLRAAELHQMAQLLVPVLTENAPVEEALRGLQRMTRREVRTWFEQERSEREYVMMLATAVFSGAAFNHVLNAAQDLYEMLFPPEEENAPQPRLFRPFQGLNTLLRTVRAHQSQADVPMEFGSARVRTLVLDNPAWQPAVVHYVWEENLLGDDFLTWLYGYGNHKHADIRYRAAAAVGALACYDFPLVRERILLPWAKGTQWEREAAAIALGIAAWDPETAPAVLGLLHHWTTVDNRRLRLAAALAYGGLVGIRYPQRALDDLHRLAQEDDFYLGESIVRAIRFLVATGLEYEDLLTQVMEALLAWTEPKDELPALVGFLAFLGFMWPEKGERENVWRPLLAKTAENEFLLHAVTTLLRRGLNWKPMRRPFLDLIHEWLAREEDGEGEQNGVARVLKHIVREGTTRERERLLYYLHIWAEKERPRLLRAQHILATI